ncbi:tripartite tricarboxylate transporter TctA family protein [Aliiruegeria haliotis]|uniref:Tripartite tricarboxylate transporter TctA family protein n=2 Tax=Aliiruegeria haliotis TaxID=1280846 RepID=A0A2T0RW23_9RHOB|nr:tripartite tricarboxylate transporter TctA family protein [Aliiruegeria haliotis]
MSSPAGTEVLWAYERFSYGSLDLYGGLRWVPMRSVCSPFRTHQYLQKTLLADFRSDTGRWIQVLRNPVENAAGIVKWAVTGVGIGALSGVSENIAACGAYGMARNSSDEPERFGKGVMAGTIAPETAINATISGAVLVLLVLRISRSPPTAVLMGALVLHNIRSGPMLPIGFAEFLFDKGVWHCWATIMLQVIGILSARPVVMILKVPPRILAPLIAILCVCRHTLGVRQHALYLRARDSGQHWLRV